MKKSELRQLIREEIKSVVKEGKIKNQSRLKEWSNDNDSDWMDQEEEVNDAKSFKRVLDENNESVNESLRSGPNDAKIYPIKKGSDPEDLLSGRSRGSWSCKNTVYDILDVFGDEMTIYKGDEITEYLQVNSRDNSYIYKIVRRDLRGSRTVGYIPSYYQDFDQMIKIDNTH
jgi:hypothetical protein